MSTKKQGLGMKNDVMKTFKIYVNGKSCGTIKTRNIEKFIKQSYKVENYKIDHQQKKVYMKVNILDIISSYSK